MGKLSADDEEQLEYIRQWHEMKETKKEENLRRKRLRKHYISMAKWHFAHAVTELVFYFKLLLGKRE